MSCKAVLEDASQTTCDCTGAGLIRQFVRDNGQICSCPPRVADTAKNAGYINSCCKTVWANMKSTDQPKLFEELKCAMIELNAHSDIKQLGTGSFGTVLAFKYKGCDYTFKLQIQQPDRTAVEFLSDLQNEVSISQFLSNLTAYKTEEEARPAAHNETNKSTLDVWKWNGAKMEKKTGQDIFQLLYTESASYVPFYIGEFRFAIEGKRYDGIISQCRPAKSGLILWKEFAKKRPNWTGILSREELQKICLIPWQALFSIHLRGILHLDIKPANMIFHCEEPGYKITGFKFIDFGLSQYCDAAGSNPGDRLLDPSTSRQQRAKCSPTYQNALMPLKCTGGAIQGTPKYGLVFAAHAKYLETGKPTGGLAMRNYYDAGKMKNSLFYDYTQLDDIHALNLSLREIYSGLDPNQAAIANATLDFILKTINEENIYTDINAILLSFLYPDIEEGQAVDVKKKSMYEGFFSDVYDAVMAEAAAKAAKAAAAAKAKKKGGAKRKTKKYSK